MPVPVTMHRTNKYAFAMKRLTKDDEAFCLGNTGCSRKVYNLCVDHLYDVLERAGYTGGDVLPDLKLPQVSELKKDYPYLAKADSLGLMNARQAFLRAVKRYNEECDHVSCTKPAKRRAASGGAPLTFRDLRGMPKFHARARGYNSYTTNCQYPKPGSDLRQPTIRLEGSRLFLPKHKAGIELVVHRPLPDDAVIGSVTISYESDGVFYASISYSYTVMMDLSVTEAALSGDPARIGELSFLGLDYSQGSFYVDSEGRKANCPHAFRAAEVKLARMQKKLSRMKRGSNNYNRLKAKIGKLHAHIRNQRRDFIEKESTHLARTYDVVVVEDIDLRSMSQALSLGKNLADNGFGLFRVRLSDKLRAKGSVLVKVGKRFPSSKTCSCCGHIYNELTLSTREWTCPECGTHHDRDENAAVNIKVEGIRIFPEYLKQYLAEEALAQKRAKALSDARRKKKKPGAA